MDNFFFTAPTRLYFGKGEEGRAGALAKRHLGDRVLVHFGGGSVKAAGLLDRVTDSLRAAGVACTLLGGVKPNPVLSLVHEGIALCKRDGITGVLAVGGGSVIDSAKVIADGACYDGEVWDFYDGKATVQRALPVGVILTIAAAGSEASVSAVITNEDGMKKRGANSEWHRPAFSILNPELTYGVSAYQTACGVSDINAHVLERYFSPTAQTELTDRWAEAILLTTMRAAPVALKTPNDYAARADILWAGTVAHNNLVGVGRVQDWASHGLSHELSALYDTAHGAALAIIFPAWMKHVWRSNPAVFVQFAHRVLGVAEYKNTEECVLTGIARYEAFLKGMGLPVRMSEAGIPRGAVDAMTARIAPALPMGGFCRLTKEDVRAIYTLAY
ncbi:MAG: iron-containing alcohol dehydrogenase [Clostridiales bacterium]|jgi:alcohol dehydrogenase YqhD (iron-dependent ADH family)|nr:iron-containing alcohol dehydrogenase [Clostridiales bacterium]